MIQMYPNMVITKLKVSLSVTVHVLSCHHAVSSLHAI